MIFMPYREAAEKPGFRWGNKYREFYEQRGTPSSDYFVEVLEKSDSFVPLAAEQIREEDLTRLIALSAELHKLANKNSYLFFFLHLVNKAIVFLIDQYPEVFDTLTEEQQEKILGFKIELPTEREIYHNVYAYLWAVQPMPAGTMSMGLSFKTLLQRIAADRPDILDTKLVSLLVSLDNEYQIFLSKMDYEDQ